MHGPDSGGPSSGTHRAVAPVAALISSSHSRVPQCSASAQPVATALTKSSHSSVTTVCESRKAVARSSSRSWNAASSSTSRAGAPSSEIGSLPSPSRRTITAVPAARSRGPSSSRMGAPRSSHSLNLNPGDTCVRLSTWTRIPASASRAASASAAAMTSPTASPRPIGTMTTWYGASRGGSTRPLSSPWVMITPPIIRVLMPNEVVVA
jgi:hypothetical protein